MKINKGKVKENWKSTPLFEKIAMIMVIIFSLLVIVVAILGLCERVPIRVANNIIMPFMCIVTGLNGITSYRKNKKLGIVILIFAAIILAMCILGFALQIMNI